MTGWRFAFSTRWFGYLALVVGFSIACVLLANWQFARLEEARDENARVTANWDRSPVPLQTVLSGLDDFEVDDKWTPVAVSGRYLDDEQLLVRGRPYGGKAGFEVLVPLELDDGSVFIVNRGWVPSGNAQDAPDAVPAPPSGRVEVVARLKPGEPVVAGRSAPEGQVATIHLPTVAELLGERTYTGAYGILASEQPRPEEARPAGVLKPDPDEGPHLSYALQWVAFAVLAFIALVWAIRHEYRARNEDDPAVQARAERLERKARARGPSDADIEDELLDRQGS